MVWLLHEWTADRVNQSVIGVYTKHYWYVTAFGMQSIFGQDNFNKKVLAEPWNYFKSNSDRNSDIWKDGTSSGSVANGKSDLKHYHTMRIRQRHNCEIIAKQHAVGADIKQFGNTDWGVGRDVQKHSVHDSPK